MAERLLKAGHDVSIWNRTRAKAEPLAAKGGKIVDKLCRSRRLRRGVLDRLDRQGPRSRSMFGKDGVALRRQAAEDRGRLLDHLGRGVGAIRKRLKEHGADFVCRAGVRQRQGDQGRQAVVGRLRPGSRLQGDDAADRGVRAAGVVLCRRGRARARLQDRAQRHARRGDREPDRDHAARPTRWACRATPSSPSSTTA